MRRDREAMGERGPRGAIFTPVPAEDVQPETGEHANAPGNPRGYAISRGVQAPAVGLEPTTL